MSWRASVLRVLACALAIGGLDPGGGAGIAADLRAFAVAGAFGCAAVSLVTIQSTAGLVAARPFSAREVAAQALEVMRHQRVRSVKVGALGSVENVRAVARLLAGQRDLSVVVDTPNLPTRGRARLLAKPALSVLRDELLPLATLATVNVAEAQALLGERIATVGEAHDAARALAGTGARAVLVKGGHLKGPYAIDVLAVDGEVVELRARRLHVGPVHGAGCILASLIAGRLANAATPPDRDALVGAIRWAKRVHHGAMARAASVGQGLRVLVF